MMAPFLSRTKSTQQTSSSHSKRLKSRTLPTRPKITRIEPVLRVVWCLNQSYCCLFCSLRVSMSFPITSAWVNTPAVRASLRAPSLGPVLSATEHPAPPGLALYARLRSRSIGPGLRSSTRSLVFSHGHIVDSSATPRRPLEAILDGLTEDPGPKCEVDVM